MFSCGCNRTYNDKSGLRRVIFSDAIKKRNNKHLLAKVTIFLNHGRFL